VSCESDVSSGPRATLEVVGERTRPSSPERLYFPELDGLRFLAFAMVFYYHCNRNFRADFGATSNVLAVGEAGWAGVDLFFVLSSFLITLLLLREKERFGAVSLRSFWVRRTLRIWPLYYFYVAIYYLVYPKVTAVALFPPAGSPAYESLFHDALLPTLFFVLNIEYTLNPGVPGSVLWSISAEEQFYLFWPFLVAKLKERALWVAVAVLTAIATAAHVYFVLSGKVGIMWANPLTRGDAFILGAALALWVNRRGTSGVSAVTKLVCLLGVPVLLGLGLLGEGHLPLTFFQIFSYWFIDLGFTLLVAATLFCRTLRSVLALPPLVWLGKRSYGLYIYHSTAQAIVRDTMTGLVESPVGRVVLDASLAFALSVLMAGLSYRLIEAPFLYLKRGYTRVQSRPV
jgi:peptidoglycan/LPS O-acetylase OafA/YrhL